MVNKRGWLRILEASLSVLLVMGVLLALFAQSRGEAEERDHAEQLAPILEEIAKNTSLREQIIESSDPALLSPQIRTFVAARMTDPSLNYTVRVCDAADACNIVSGPEEGTNVFSAQRIISATPDSMRPVKIKIFVWKRTG